MSSLFRVTLAYLGAATGLATVFGLAHAQLSVAVPVAVFIGLYIGVLVPRRVVVRPTVNAILAVVHREGAVYTAHCAASGTGDTPQAALAALNANLNDDKETRP